VSGSLNFPDIHTPWLMLSLFVLLLSSGLSIYFASKRLRGQPRRLTFVVVLNVLASIALIGLVADVRLSKVQLSQAWLFSAGSMPLSTENQQRLDASPEAQLFILPEVTALAAGSLNKAQLISEPTQIMDWQPSLQQLTIVGDGLSPAQWQALKANNTQLSIDFMPSTPLTGLLNMRWNKQIIQGEILSIAGRLHIADQDSNPGDLYTLALFDPMGNKVAEQNLRAGENFIFSVQPSASGNWLYQLSLSDAAQNNNSAKAQAVIISENVAVAVQSATTLKILIYQSAPSFETRQLREWAGSFANPVTVISQISKNKHLTQHFNYQGQTPNHMELLELADLNQFDLMVMDGRALGLISQQEWLALKQAVQQGLGLLLLADQSLQSALQLQDSALADKIYLSPIIQQGAAQTVVPNWPNSQIEQAIQAQPINLLISQGLTLVFGERQQALVSSLSMGLGKIGVSLLNSTYQWQTSGATAQYSHYWQYLLSQLAANRQPAYWLAQTPDRVMLLNQHSSACALSELAAPQAVLEALDYQSVFKLSLVSTLIQQDRHCTSYWPQHSGWQQLKLFATGNEANNPAAVSSVQNQYVYEPNNWMAWQQRQKQQSSMYHVQLSQSLAKPQAQEHSYILSKLWFWLLLVTACGFLWVERKQF
jgi:hypothetical protein